jgi:hypothetical protein
MATIYQEAMLEKLPNPATGSCDEKRWHDHAAAGIVSKELSVVAEGVGSEILPLVLTAAAGGQCVWMKPP